MTLYQPLRGQNRRAAHRGGGLTGLGPVACCRVAAVLLAAALVPLFFASCGPVAPGGNQNPCGIEAPGCASETLYGSSGRPRHLR